MEIYTIGFTKKTAAEFFESLSQHGIERLVDVRVNNTSQLAAFAKRDDLAYFVRELVGADYVHEPLLAPTKELLKAYREGDLFWEDYAAMFLKLMADRRVEDVIPRELFTQPAVLLCSEASLADLNRRLTDPVPMDRFRPNLVVNGGPPFAEDHWQRLAIGSVVFRNAGPCARCTVTTVDQDTGHRGTEPLRTLATYRQEKRGVMFGVNLVPEGPGQLAAGDPVEILD
jgi:hypothetical protein